MNISTPKNSPDPNLCYTIKTNGKVLNDTYSVVSINICHELNRISSAIIILNDGVLNNSDSRVSDSDDLIPGKLINITAGYGSGGEDLIFEGRVVMQSVELSESGQMILILTCKHQAVAMTVNQTDAEFQAKTDSEMISLILQNYSQVKSTIQESIFVHEATILKSITDWDFIVSRAIFLGYVISMDEKTLNISLPIVTGTPVLSITLGESMHGFKAALNSESQLPSVITNAWDQKTQALITAKSREPVINKQGNLNGKELASVFDQKPLNLFSGVGKPLEELQIWADSTLLRMRMSAIRGSVIFSGSALAKTGTLIELSGVGTRFNGDAYISAVNQRLEANSWVTTVKFGLETTLLPDWVSVSTLPVQDLFPGNSMITSDKVQSLLISDLNGNSITLTSSGISIESGKDINLKASGNIMLDAANIEIAAGQDINLSGSTVNTTAKTSITTKSDGTAELSATTTTTVKGAMVMIN